MSKIMVVGSTYGMTEEEEKRLDLYMSTLKKFKFWGGNSFCDSHTFDYEDFHKVFFPEFQGIDEIQIFCRRNDPKNFYFLTGIICGQTEVPVKVLEEFSDQDAGLYKKLNAREGMNQEFAEMQSYFSKKKSLGIGFLGPIFILGLISIAFSIFNQIALTFITFGILLVLWVVWMIYYIENVKSFSQTKENVKEKYS